MVHWRGIAQCVAVGVLGGGGMEGNGGVLLLLLLLWVRLVWLPVRAAAEAAELLLPFASCVYFSLLHVPEWEERSWRRWALPPSGTQRPAWARPSSSSIISSGSTLCTRSGHFCQTCNLLLGFIYPVDFCIFQHSSGLRLSSVALLGPIWFRSGSDGLYLGLAGQPAVLLDVRQVSLKKEAARSNMSLMLCRWEQNNFTMKLVGWFQVIKKVKSRGQ